MVLFFFFKKKTAYEMRISDWSSDVCSSDLRATADTDRILWQLRRIHDETVLRSILPRVECARPQHDLLWNTRRRRTGRAWHDGGRLQNKANAQDDLIACGEKAVSLGLTVSRKLAITEIGRAHV